MNTLQQKAPANPDTPGILIVEDDLDDQMLLKIAFDSTAQDFSLHFAGNANEALHYLQNAPDDGLPDLIVSDYNLPLQNGLKLLHQLNGCSRYDQIEKAILSNSNYFPGPENLKVHQDRCFVKPHSLEGMKQLAEDLLQLCQKKTRLQPEKHLLAL
jgi:CheY-like chemotaxis protein